MMYNDTEKVVNTMLDFIEYKFYHATEVLQPIILNICNDLEKQYIL